jgi:hypothetical protein
VDSELAAALARIEQRQAAYEVVAHRLIGMLEIHNEKLDAILEAATVEPGPSPTTEVLVLLARSVCACGMDHVEHEHEHEAAEVAATLAATNGASLPRIEIVEERRRVQRCSVPLACGGGLACPGCAGAGTSAAFWDLHEPDLSVAVFDVGPGAQSACGQACAGARGRGASSRVPRRSLSCGRG